jgi:hypothetical protein
VYLYSADLINRFVGLVCLLWLVSTAGTAQQVELRGQVTDAVGGAGIAYVNIGLPAKNIGTVSNMQGEFALRLNDTHADDTLLFSCIGYESLFVPVSVLRELELPLVMQRKQMALPEVVIKPRKTRERFLGHFTQSNIVQAGFSENVLGKECGVLIQSKKPALLEEVKINFGKVSYDSIFFRLNIYQQLPDGSFEPAIAAPIYLAYSKYELLEPLSINLKTLDLQLSGSFMISVEYIRDMGPGILYFKSKLNGSSYIRETSQGKWVKIPLGLSIGVFAQVSK